MKAYVTIYITPKDLIQFRAGSCVKGCYERSGPYALEMQISIHGYHFVSVDGNVYNIVEI